MEKKYFALDQRAIMQFLPHRAPFLLIDKIIEISGPNPMDDDNPKHKIGIKVIGMKNVTVNEPHFQGHFPEIPVMPGVLILEAMAQISSFSMYPSAEKAMRERGEKFQCVLVGVDNARFRTPVMPGDTLRIETEVTACRTYLWSFACKGYVEGKLVAEANILANLVPTSQKTMF